MISHLEEVKSICVSVSHNKTKVDSVKQCSVKMLWRCFAIDTQLCASNSCALDNTGTLLYKQ